MISDVGWVESSETQHKLGVGWVESSETQLSDCL